MYSILLVKSVLAQYAPKHTQILALNCFEIYTVCTIGSGCFNRTFGAPYEDSFFKTNPLAGKKD